MTFKAKLAGALFMLSAIGLGAAGDTQADEGTVAVWMETDMGSIRIEVYTDKAPVSAGDFLKYVDGGFYNDAAFYCVVRHDNDKGSPTIEVIQGGLPDGENPLPPVAHETTAHTGILHLDGTISLARSEPGTGGANAFFICIGDQPSLDHGGLRNPDGQGFAAFGIVTEGMALVREIQQMESNAPVDSEYVEGQYLTKPVRIRRAYREKKLHREKSAEEKH